jgi:UDP-N-acetylmuramate dehydrogenase
MSWLNGIQADIRRKEPLALHTSFHIGGPAELFVRPRDVRSLQRFLARCVRRRIPVRVIGAGSNILVGDRGVKGAVICLSAPAFGRIRRNRGGLSVGAGLRLNRLIGYCMQRGLSGAEYLAGIPGTIGGAVKTNAGVAVKHDRRVSNHWIGDLVESLTIMDYNGAIKRLRRHDLRFGYRCSCLPAGIILAVSLRLSARTPGAIRRTVAELMSRRSRTQAAHQPSAGCVFKNPPQQGAGQLIDRCGLKGARCGDACVSPLHANFIVNLGQARAVDVLALMRRARAAVKKKFHLALEPEIHIWE